MWWTHFWYYRNVVCPLLIFISLLILISFDDNWVIHTPTTKKLTMSVKYTLALGYVSSILGRTMCTYNPDNPENRRINKWQSWWNICKYLHPWLTWKVPWYNEYCISYKKSIKIFKKKEEPVSEHIFTQCQWFLNVWQPRLVLAEDSRTTDFLIGFFVLNLYRIASCGPLKSPSELRGLREQKRYTPLPFGSGCNKWHIYFVYENCLCK